MIYDAYAVLNKDARYEKSVKSKLQISRSEE